jgi:N-acetylmuramoyl-L-alanine amidase
VPQKHIVQQGDCISSIAAEYGFLPESLWNDPANAQLKSRRKDMNVLLPGDVVNVPDKRLRSESRATGAKHRFRRKGVPSHLRVRLVIDDEALAHETYELHVGSQVLKGTTDGAGWLDEPIPPGATDAMLFVGAKRQAIPLQLGTVDPESEVSGAQARLRNLGYYDGDATGELNESTAAALTLFQQRQGLRETGKLDAATQQKLRDAHGG